MGSLYLLALVLLDLMDSRYLLVHDLLVLMGSLYHHALVLLGRTGNLYHHAQGRKAHVLRNKAGIALLIKAVATARRGKAEAVLLIKGMAVETAHKGKAETVLLIKAAAIARKGKADHKAAHRAVVLRIKAAADRVAHPGKADVRAELPVADRAAAHPAQEVKTTKSRKLQQEAISVPFGTGNNMPKHLVRKKIKKTALATKTHKV